MPAWPAYAHLLLAGYGESRAPSLLHDGLAGDQRARADARLFRRAVLHVGAQQRRGARCRALKSDCAGVFELLNGPADLAFGGPHFDLGERLRVLSEDGDDEGVMAAPVHARGVLVGADVLRDVAHLGEDETCPFTQMCPARGERAADQTNAHQQPSANR